MSCPICNAPEFEDMSKIFKEGTALAATRDITIPASATLEEHEVPYPLNSLKEMAFVFGFSSHMVGRYAAGYLASLKKPTNPSPSVN